MKTFKVGSWLPGPTVFSEVHTGSVLQQSEDTMVVLSLYRFGILVTEMTSLFCYESIRFAPSNFRLP